MNLKRTLTSKTCESCGQVFDCGASAGSCWCMKVSTAADVLEKLRASYEDCLCSVCLYALSEDGNAKKTV